MSSFPFPVMTGLGMGMCYNFFQLDMTESLLGGGAWRQGRGFQKDFLTLKKGHTTGMFFPSSEHCCLCDTYDSLPSYYHEGNKPKDRQRRAKQEAGRTLCP